MKRKFFSKLLMGVIAIATISIVACKDYDDDINNLQEQINKKALSDDVTTLQSKLDALTTSSKTALETAEAALAKANDAATKDALEAVKAAATKAGEDAAQAIAKANSAQAAADAAQTSANAAQNSANAAQATADAAKTTADAAAQTANEAKDAAAAAKEAVAKAEQAAKEAAEKAAAAVAAQQGVEANSAKIAELEAQLQAIATAQQTYATQAALTEQVDLLKQLISEEVAKIDINNMIELTPKHAEIIFGDASRTRANLQDYVTGMTDVVDQIWAAITSIHLFYNQHNEGNRYGFDHTLTFVSVEELDNIFPKEEGITNEQVIFKKGVFRTYTDSIMVRVSPVTADLTTSDIRLINSQGEDIVKSGLIKIEKVEKFNKYLTRGSETGLWTITFKLADGEASYDAETFQAAKEVKVNGVFRNILYAVAVANTESAEDRYIVSEYDLDLATEDAYHCWPFNVNSVAVSGIHNRYEYCEGQYAIRTVDVPELAWIDVPGAREAYTDTIWKGDDANVVNRPLGGEFYDNRQASPMLSVVPGDDDIVIEYDALWANPAVGTVQTPLKAFYVTLDQDFALESSPSEINAWTAYDYDGTVGYKVVNNGKVVETVKAPMQYGNTGAIRIKNTHNVIGDVIGFRIYAVNLDGTLVDPDGRAFYVKVVSDIDEQEEVKVDVTAYKKTGTPIDLEETAHNSASINLASTYDPTSKIRYELQVEYADGCEDIYYHPYGTAPYFATPLAGMPNGLDRYIDENGSTTSDYGTIKSQRFQFRFEHTDGGVLTSHIMPNNADDAISKIYVYLPNPDYVLDGGVYKFMLKVIRKEFEDTAWDYSTGTAVNLTSRNPLTTDTIQYIPLTVKKLLPVGIPEAFSLKTGQEANIAPLTLYVKPVQPLAVGGWSTDEATLNVPATKAGWMNAKYWDVTMDGSIPGINDAVTHVADIYPFDLADMFNDLDENVAANRAVSLDPNYAFEFEESDVDADGEDVSIFLKTVNVGGVSTSTAFSFPSWSANTTTGDHYYTIPLIGKKFVSLKSNDRYVNGDVAEGKKVLVSYIYRNVSLYKDANEINGFKQGDWWQQTNTVRVSGSNNEVPFTVKYRNALDVNLLDIITEDQLNKESGITGSAAADKWAQYKWRMEHRFFLQIVDYENGYNMLSWPYDIDGTATTYAGKNKVVNVTMQAAPNTNLIKSIDPQWKVKNVAPTGAQNVFPLDRIVYNFGNFMGDYVTSQVYLQRAGLIPVGQNYWGTLANLNNDFKPSLWDLIRGNFVKVIPESLDIDIKDYFTPAFVTTGSVDYDGDTANDIVIDGIHENGIVLVPTDRDLLHPALTAPLLHTVTFDVVDCFGFKKTISIQFYMLAPRIDQTAARQK